MFDKYKRNRLAGSPGIVRYAPALLGVIIIAVLGCGLDSVRAQTFSSGSNGSDGALDYSTPGIYYFDPKASNPPLDPEGDNVFHFTTINIASGVTLKMSSKILTGSVYWLAQGNVTINGTIDLSGENGHPATTNASDRILPAAGGAGGYSGGVGGALNTSTPPQPGNGPGGGAAATGPPGSGPPSTGGGGQFTGSQFLIPLIGGSGGGGGTTVCGGATLGGGGGAGGGAILIASSASITFINNATITVAGGAGGKTVDGCGNNVGGGGGSGGAIRLIAPSITANGGALLNAGGGLSLSSTTGSAGRIRLEAFSTSGNFNPNGPISTSTPFNVVPPTTPPTSVLVTSINGMVINANPFSFPDATINSSGPVTVNVQARYIPLGTIPKIFVMSESGPDQTVNCSPLAGTLQQSTCSASITFATGGSRGFVKATW